MDAASPRPARAEFTRQEMIDGPVTPPAVALAVAGAIASERNCAAASFSQSLRQFLPTGYGRAAGWVTIYDADGVTVQVADAETLLAMKVYAARKRRPFPTSARSYRPPHTIEVWADRGKIPVPGHAKTPASLENTGIPGASHWRYRWDLNPRWAFTHTTFRELHLRPLGHGTAEYSTRAG